MSQRAYLIVGTYALHGDPRDLADVKGTIWHRDQWSAQAAICELVALGERFTAAPWDLEVRDYAGAVVLRFRSGVPAKE